MNINYKKITHWEIDGEDARLYDKDNNEVDVLYIDELIREWINEEIKRAKKQ